MIYLQPTTTSPSFNLALEQYVFDKLNRANEYFMLWQNENAVIVGRYQNTLEELNGAFVEEHGIQVVRRLSGGGAVYHDLGNLNFTYIVDCADYQELDLSRFTQSVAQALQSLGVPAQVNGRNDITIDGKKFSGNAQYVRQRRVMHHGTIMFDSDLDMVSKVLNVDQSKIQSKGIKSVRSRVTNVRPYLREDVTLERFKKLLVEKMFRDQPLYEYTLTENDLAYVKALEKERYGSWSWNYGASPPCTLKKKRRVEGCGAVEALIGVTNGVISDLNFAGDFFSPGDPADLARRFIGLRPQPEDYQRALEGADVEKYIARLSREQLLDILIQ